MMEMVQIDAGQTELIEQAAVVLARTFPWNDEWNTVHGAREEVHEILREGVVFAAVGNGQVLGLVGGLITYHGKTWELHPLAVRAGSRRSGVGRALVARLEEAARVAGAVTVMVGADDEDGRTNLSQIDDVYPLLPGLLADIVSLDPTNPHPVDFYRKCGYQVVGLMPDANGPRKPDILMAKRL
ncbi:MAG: GNAT family N-acetyltransferase [Chloroflexi bacterium]|nr:GNAT family N-acetyltransferase [Chloroflexota bacterium]